MTSAPLPVVVNRRGGTARSFGDALGERIVSAFAASGAKIDLRLVEGSAIGETVAGFDAPVIAVGGGDGTLSAAAAQLAGGETALAVLPLGTRNHLARQLGIPLDLPEAAMIAATGCPTAIDLGRCGKRIFVNNASIGLYTRLVRDRDRRAGPKWLGTVPAAWHVLRRLRPAPLTLTVDGVRREARTLLLFIGNNRYSLSRGRVGERDSLNEGVLSLFAVEPKPSLALAAFALRTLAGRADPERDFCALADAREVTIEGAGAIEVACDGEVQRMELPLRFSILPAALKVLTPDRSRARAADGSSALVGRGRAP